MNYMFGTQITYHLPMDRWSDAPGVELDHAPEFDGHSSSDVIERLKNQQIIGSLT
jgi:hypothetical protein